MKNTSLLLLILSLLIVSACQSKQSELDSFEPTVESLRNYECPEWFRDAKFGIYCSWNAQSTYKSDYYGWQARQIYEEDRPSYQLHLEQFGHPSEVGYKDVIMRWHADEFDADVWAKLFKRAGAKYMVAMANHHDNFDFWDSKYQLRWNSTNYGPKVDVVGEVKKAAHNNGLRFGVTTHLARAYSWMQTNKGADKSGPYAGVPYDGNDPAYQDLYLPADADANSASPINAPLWWREHWKKRICDLIDQHSPDHLYFDGGIPFMGDDSIASGLEVISHYYNHNAKMHNGKNEGVMFIKDVPKHAVYVKGVASLDFEGGQSNEILKDAWQTDAGISYWPHNKNNCSWFYNEKAGYYSVQEMVEKLSDIVSKNGNLLLNVPPKGDGSFDQATIDLLTGIGDWLAINGEAIYGTRPWHVYGEESVRYTTHGKHLYAIIFAGDFQRLTLKETKALASSKIKAVESLSGEDIAWSSSARGLEITAIPQHRTLPIVIKIECKKDVSIQ